MNRFSKYLSHLLLCVLTTMSVPLPLWSQATQGSLTLSQVDDTNPANVPYLQATLKRTPYAPWVVERSLAMSTGANGPWFSYYQEPGTRISAFEVSTKSGPNGPIVDPITLRLRDLPAYPPPLPASSPTPGWTRPRYLHAHTILQLAANGAVYARWPSLGAATVAETVFNVVGGVPELNLLNPDPAAENQNRPIFGGRHPASERQRYAAADHHQL